MRQLSEYRENLSVPIWHISVPFQHINAFLSKSRGAMPPGVRYQLLFFQLQVWSQAKKE
ncbi:hypothetical protein P353_23920 [Comamonas testosteroni]|uniref:Uncharacterized protein n=1 Tax=Comamonas testosteroni TaxID=285 RepID=A0A096F8Q6_COMTE|nr:hypothetical protein P353_23920 [Comamonas testosteroni]